MCDLQAQGRTVRQMALAPALSALALVVIGVPPLRCQETQVVANQFDIGYQLVGSTLTFWLETDLPDDTNVMVSVSRSYTEVGSAETYSVDYFGEKSKIGFGGQTVRKIGYIDYGGTNDIGDRSGTGFLDGVISSSVVQDLNFFPGNSVGGTPVASPGDTLSGHNDWANIRLAICRV